MAKILVVDDDGELRDGLKEFLERADYTVVTAINGYDGLRKAQVENPDLVVTDLNMPVMKGNELLKALRESGFDKPIIMFYTAVNDQARATFIEMRATGVADKINGPGRLLNEIRRALAKSGEGTSSTGVVQ